MSFQRIAWGITGAGHFLDRSYQVFKELKLKDRDISVNTYFSRAAEEVLRMYGLEQKLIKISGGDYLEEIFREVAKGHIYLVVQMPDGEEIVIESKSRLKPLPVLEGYIPEGWKDAIVRG